MIKHLVHDKLIFSGGLVVLAAAAVIVSSSQLATTPSLSVTDAQAASTSPITCGDGVNVVVPPPSCSPGMGQAKAGISYSNDGNTNDEIKIVNLAIASPSTSLTIRNFWGWSGSTLASAQKQPNEEHDTYLTDGAGKVYGPFHCIDYGDYPTYRNPLTDGGTWVNCSTTDITIPWNTSWNNLTVKFQWNSTNTSTPGSHEAMVYAFWCGKSPVNPTTAPVYPTTPPLPTSSTGSPLTLKVLSGPADSCTKSSCTSAGRITVGYDSGKINSGFTFKNVTIPQGKVITSAYLTLYSKYRNLPTQTLPLKVYAHNTSNSSDFSSLPLEGRSKTTANVSWNLVFPDGRSNEVSVNTPNIASIVQEIISKTGWNSGNTLTILVDYNSSQTTTKDYWSVEGYDLDSPHRAAMLVIEYR